MADIKHSHAAVAPTGPTEGDGVSYRGIVWFVVILVVTTVVCAGIVWVYHAWALKRADREAAPVVHQMEAPPPPNLITLDSVLDRDKGQTQPLMAEGEPTYLKRFRTQEDAALASYGWVDQNAGVVRIPIDRAKTLLLERGLPVRSAGAAAKDKD
jgi:hypothetical protein